MVPKRLSVIYRFKNSLKCFHSGGVGRQGGQVCVLEQWQQWREPWEDPLEGGQLRQVPLL